MEQKLYSKDILIDIKSMVGFARQLLGRGKTYENLLSHFLSKYCNDDVDLPSLKLLQSELNTTYTILHKQIQSIYEDLMNYEESEIDYSVKKVEYIFSLRYFDSYKTFKLDYLPVVPRVGENIEIPFCRAILGTQFFHVDSIHHYITAEKQVIGIWLRHGGYNHYFKWRKDEAYLKHEISRDEYYSPMDYNIKEKLKLRVY